MVFRYLLTMLNPKANVKISTIFIKTTSIFDKTAPILDKTTSILYLFFGLSTFLSFGRNCYYERCFCSPALQHIMLAPLIVCTSTSINSLWDSVKYPHSLYDLNGQRINRLQKGLNIVDGRKVWVR